MPPLYDYSMRAEFWRRANREDASGKAPIFLRITIAKQRAEVASGIEVPEAYWNIRTHLIEQPDRKELRRAEYTADRLCELNAQLVEMKYSADQMYKELRKKAPPTARQVRESMRGVGTPEAAPLTMPQACQKFLAAMKLPGMNKSPDTIRTYESRLKNILDFFKTGLKQPHCLVRDVSLPVARALERWCLAQTDNDGHPRFEHSSMSRQVNMLQMVVAWAAIEGEPGVPVNALHGYKYQAKAIPKMPRYLPPPEVSLLASTVFVSEPLNATVDMWLFSCYTALSFVDYIRFANDPLAFLYTDSHGREWIRMVRQKMMKRKPEGFSVPFFPEARAIFERRRGRLPIKDNRLTNAQLKEISKELDLSLMLTFKDSRSTFAQRWRDAGVSTAVVAAMMGDEERVVNKNYSKVRETTIGNELTKLQLVPSIFPSPA
jgi:hypothetical protein